MKIRILAMIACAMVILQLGMLPAYGASSLQNASQTPDIRSEAALLMDLRTGKLLFDKDSHKKMYPASITKIMTAMLVLENLDLDETITVGKEISLTEKDSSGAGLRIGEKITGRDLIWAMMLPSGNDAAYTAAVTVARKKANNASIKISDAVNSFTDFMNIRAQEIGCKGTNFANPDGYPAENHYSTAYDMALIAREALRNDFFRQVVGTYTYQLEESQSGKANVKSQAAWINRNQMINRNSKYYYEYANGIKTGSTSLAGYCLAASARKGDMDLVAIVLKAGTEEARWVDSKALFEFGFNNFKYRDIMRKGEAEAKVTAVRKYLNDEIELNALVNKDYSDILSDTEYGRIRKTIEWDPALIAGTGGKNGGTRLIGPIREGQVLGKVTYELDGQLLAESELTADRDSMKGNFTDTIYEVIDYGLTHLYVPIALFLVLATLVMLLIRLRGSARRAA